METAVPSSYIAVVEALGTNKADFAAFNVFSYILAKDVKKYPIKAIFTVKRSDGKTYYQSQIVAHTDSKVNKLSDLNGKKFAFSDPASTSGYIIPQDMLKKAKVNLGERMFAYRHDNVISMVYNKQVDAGSTYYSDPVEEIKDGKKTLRYRDARDRVSTQYPDVFEKVKIIKLSGPIPNEPWVIRTNLYENVEKNKKVKLALKESLLSFSKTEKGKAILKDIYDFKELIPVADKDYDEIRAMVLNSKLDLEAEASKKKGK